MSETPEQQVARIAARKAGITPEEAERNEQNALSAKRAEVLELMREGVSIVDAAACVGRDRGAIWRWRQDPDYAADFEAAVEEGLTARTAHRREMREGIADKALRVLHECLDGKPVTREAMTVAIFTAKSELGMVETSRVENFERVRIVDDTSEV